MVANYRSKTITNYLSKHDDYRLPIKIGGYQLPVQNDDYQLPFAAVERDDQIPEVAVSHVQPVVRVVDQVVEDGAVNDVQQKPRLTVEGTGLQHGGAVVGHILPAVETTSHDDVTMKVIS